VEIREAREESESEANFTQVDVLLQYSADITLELLPESDTIMNGSMSQSILHGGMAHADHMLPSAAALLKQKLSNMHVIFDLFTYCRVLLTEVRSVCKSSRWYK